MSDLVTHPLTRQSLDDLVTHPRHAILLVGLGGIGKGSVARQLAAQLLVVPTESLANHPYVQVLGAGKEKSISIDAVRELEHFLSRKVPGDGKRLVIIEDAHLMTTEAQNALLKTLEEPPQHTTLILTASSEHALLPTIRSRSTIVPVKRPDQAALAEHFTARGSSADELRKVQLMSGGLPGLMHALLYDDTEHPLVAAAATAREIVQKSMFERLAMVDSLAKDKEKCLDVLTILQQMAHVSLANGSVATTWQRILAQSYEASELLRASAQTKLVLTNLMLSL